jgi:glycosyltransferase involved in cell wall biosynthesis
LLWCTLNKVPWNKIELNIKKLNPHTDLLYGWGTVNSICEDDKLSQISPVRQFKGKKIFHLSHYYTNTKIIANNLKVLGCTNIAAEADLRLSSNNYFQKYFPDHQEVYVLPFTFASRFDRHKNFSERKNKALALGTYIEIAPDDKNYRDFIDYFNITALHPMRKKIYQERKQITEQIDSIISKQPFEDDEEKNQKAAKASKLEFYLLKIFNKEQKNYLGLDIVEQFNSYKMIISPEEIIGLPSINFVEAMSCGSAYIGLDSEIYSQLGLEKNKDYISYNGDLDDLLMKIKYYQNHPEELEKIAESGCQKIRKKLEKSKVLETFYQDLKNYSLEGKLDSSFRSKNV